jgi:hypothetical protein
VRILFRARADLMRRVREDLTRPHSFAAERVGFLACRAGRLDDGGIVILAVGYGPVANEDYVDDVRVGAMMGAAAIRKALQLAYNDGRSDLSLFHIHMHEHSGLPGFSRVDVAENRQFVPDFFNVAPAMPHGAIVLSRDRATGRCWLTKEGEPTPITRFSNIGAPLDIWDGA